MAEAELKSVRMIFEVVAGLLPGMNPDVRFTKKFIVLSDDWYDCNNQQEQDKLIYDKYKEATEYAGTLLNPGRFNWVRIDWVYF